MVRQNEKLLSLKELQSLNESYFVSSTKIGKNTTYILNYTLSHQTKYLHIEN